LKEEHNHSPGEICYECGYGLKKVSWKCIVLSVILGLAFGIYLAGSSLTQQDVVSYLTLVLIAVILGLLLDIRKMILNVDFKEK
jgi:hypothetical protein